MLVFCLHHHPPIQLSFRFTFSLGLIDTLWVSKISLSYQYRLEINQLLFGLYFVVVNFLPTTTSNEFSGLGMIFCDRNASFLRLSGVTG